MLSSTEMRSLVPAPLSKLSSKGKGALKGGGSPGGMAVENKDGGDGRPQRAPREQNDELSLVKLMPAVAVCMLVSVGSFYASQSAEVSEDVIVATFRTFAQLTVLAALLSPLFRLVEGGGEHRADDADASFSQMNLLRKLKMRYSAPFMVLAYVFGFMLTIAAYEASSRSRLTLHPANPAAPSLFNEKIVLLIVMLSLFVAVSTMGAVAIFAIIRPVPRYSPRHVIPLCGMLFNNALTAISLALDALFAELRSKSETIELMISFGGDPWTATRPTFRSVLASSLKPQLNSMNVIGLVAIPGMMTGQVLGGASPTRAARYQIMIMCLILGSSFVSICMTTEMVIWNAFGERGALMDDWIVDNKSLRVSQLLSSLPAFWTARDGIIGIADNAGDESQSLDGTELSEPVTVKLSVHGQRMEEAASGEFPFFQVGLAGRFAKGGRIMNIDFTIPNHGGIAVLTGASGIGKTTLLKTISELNSGFVPSGTSPVRVALSGRDRASFSPSEWRRHVLYLPQAGASGLRGTPISFLAFVASSTSQDLVSPPLTLDQLTSWTEGYMEAWGMKSPGQTLTQPWTQLSGGESQRVLLAVALATGPSLLLLDEPTSMLDLETKLAVEGSMKESASRGCSMIMVTHDQDQADRLGTMLMSLDVVTQQEKHWPSQ